MSAVKIREMRDALFAIVAAIDITSITGIDEETNGWAMREKKPPKQVAYPGFWVEPVSDIPNALDSWSNETTFTFGITFVGSYEDAEIGEDDAIELVDLVRPEILTRCKAGIPLADGVFDGNPTGQWGADERYGQRVYRIDVTLRAQEFFTP